MQPQRRSALRLLLVGLAAGACTDQTPPTAIPAGLTPLAAAAAGANNQKVNVKAILLSSNTLRIDGPSVSGKVRIGNSGLAILTGVTVRAEISQGTVSKQAVNAPVQCSEAEGDVGKLPTGTCETSFAAVASNLSGSPGMLTPGSATFTLHVFAGDTELASKSQLVNLVGAVGMTVSVAPTTVLIDGPPSTATAIIQNPAKALQGVLVQGWIVQGTTPNQTRRPTGQSPVTCGPNAGVLPAGTCTMTLPVTASNVGDGVGLFASGAATFELELIQTGGSSNTTLDVETASVTMVWGSPHFTRVEVQSTTVEIGGPDVGFTVDMQNGGAPRSGIILSVEILQFFGLNFINKDAGSIVVNCGSGPAELPTTGTGVCTMQSNLRASDDINGGAFTAGPAVVFFDILSGTGVLDRQRVDITLTEKPVRITNVSLSPTIPLASGSSPYTATIQNTGPSLSNVVLQTWITQGTARRAAGGRAIQCGTGAIGELPTGSCSVSSSVAASNDPASGNGTLVPGPATLEIDVDQQSGLTTNLAKRLIPVTLVIAGPTIIRIELPANVDVVAGQELTYTVTFYNPTGSTISGLGIQGILSQGSIEVFGTGGFSLQCPGAAQGDLPPGACIMPFLTLNTRNIDGIPAWQLGPATWRLDLSADADGTVLNSQTRTINFVGIQ